MLFNLLFEVYLRKVPALDDSHRLSVSDIKFAQILKWVVYYDLDHSYNYFNGLVIDGTPQDTPEIQEVVQFTVEETEAGIRLDKLLSIRYPDQSREYFKGLIEKGFVLLNEQVPKKRIQPKVGDSLRIETRLVLRLPWC